LQEARCNKDAFLCAMTLKASCKISHFTRRYDIFDFISLGLQINYVQPKFILVNYAIYAAVPSFS
jgi:hypothetical protein